ncbi:universal stress protein [Erwinia amylovora]|uniref:Universal stress protein SERP1273 n=4 Tax=Erwinia amylovora TaxID=552 RepID=A0A831A324_ERWAM|nr:universal stress protein [Erwinia amylovora]CBX81350.1 putative universal stress protein SERP1273 [Erwinia amylovora ATCC BAA-2158]CDK15874.1 putative universal stress protein [Erwinia amylovora LA635]CDK19240.1 putative universal stress protein [Erwinia amylovora LA636]CDK22611.1 putative universal stress protein [Erwinia amylovora LA637]ATZ12153.1 universal stress protein [Erwinia amylovora]
MQTLLVAIDNSVIARKVVALASIQALALQAQVVVVCCIDTGYACGPLEIKAGEDLVDCELTRDEQNTAEAVVRQALAELQRAGVTASGRVLAGKSAQTIVAEANSLQAAMIIMGRRHLSPVNRLLKGSCSAAVIEHASCPVLVDVRID